jgi:hypothetical protein
MRLSRHLLLLAVTTALPGLAHACYCYQIGSPCQLQKEADAVFLGKVISIDVQLPEAGTNSSERGPARYHFSVDEAFKGVNTAEIDVDSENDSCDYHFKAGETYLVYSYAGKDHSLQASLCSPTRPAEQAAALLQQLRNARDGHPVASLFGTVRREQGNFPGAIMPGSDGPLKNIVVRLMSSAGRMFSAQTDEMGRYAFYNIAPGEYGFTADVRTYSELPFLRGHLAVDPPDPNPVKIPGDYPELLELTSESCSEHDVQDIFAGEIRVRVVQPNGEPVHGHLSLFGADQYALEGGRNVETAGISEFRNVAPGEYIVVFNNDDGIRGELFHRTFYPDSRDLAHAVRIRLDEGQVANVTLQLRDPIEMRPLTVKLGWQGEPPANMPLFVTVHSNTSEFIFVERLAPGVFSADIRSDGAYIVQGESYCGPFMPVATQPVIVEGRALQNEVALTLSKSLCGAK